MQGYKDSTKDAVSTQAPPGCEVQFPLCASFSANKNLCSPKENDINILHPTDASNIFKTDVVCEVLIDI